MVYCCIFKGLARIIILYVSILFRIYLCSQLLKWVKIHTYVCTHKNTKTHTNMAYIHGKSSSNLQDVVWYCVYIVLAGSWWETVFTDDTVYPGVEIERRACSWDPGNNSGFWIRSKHSIIFQGHIIICSSEHLSSSHFFALCSKPHLPGFTLLLKDSSARCRCWSRKATLRGYLFWLSWLSSASCPSYGPWWPCCQCCHVFTPGLARGSQQLFHTVCCTGHFDFTQKLRKLCGWIMKRTPKPTTTNNNKNCSEHFWSSHLFPLNHSQK